MPSPTVSAQPTEAELDALWDSLRNWGRWGDDDELGTLNHLTPAQRQRAAQLVVDGATVSLARDLGVTPSPETPFPAHHHMLAAGDARENSGIPGYEASRDYVGTEIHGLGITHVDALCHMFVRGEMYNGRPAADVRSDGARTNTVMALADGVVGRGVLLDIVAAQGGEPLAGGAVVTRAELEAAEQALGVTVGTGDIVCIATGRDARRAASGGLLDPRDGMAGIHADCLPWLAEREVALLGSDGISDPMPGLGIPSWPFPVHQIGIAGVGLPLIDNMHLGRLSERCAAAGRYEFLFTLGTLRIAGGTGCPANPIAVL
jgi:kynurenine formamidase